MGRREPDYVVGELVEAADSREPDEKNRMEGAVVLRICSICVLDTLGNEVNAARCAHRGRKDGDYVRTFIQYQLRSQRRERSKLRDVRVLENEAAIGRSATRLVANCVRASARRRPV